ncbi:MAG: methylenetetrahydrofolate reductase [NAD(P)H] [Propionibacteriaceae bacterium]|nr:methylenetetrahydrofolate reductase [NAD(P)H] [Propionibacteriaceae bacterium]
MPSIPDLLASSQRPLFSFEFFPPATAEAEERLWAAIAHLEGLKPDFVSVTYGASGSSRDRTISITRRIVAETGLRTMAHLTCVAQTRSELMATVESYAKAGVRHVLAIRGDMPGGPTVPWEAHPEGLRNATELVRLVKEVDPAMHVGVAAFPDVHPQARDADLDAQILIDKAEAGASFAITQMFFDAGSYAALVERVRARGCDLPIIPGIQPVTALGQIERFAELCGADLPAGLVAKLRAATTPEQLRLIGSSEAARLCTDLLDAGAPGLHFFTLNRSLATREIFAMLLERDGSHP